MVSLSTIQNQIPDFLLKSETFLCVLLDVDGKLLKLNAALKGRVNFEADFFTDLLEASAVDPVEKLLDELLLTPKKKEYSLINFKSDSTSSWWEFSMVVNSENDPVGFIGIGLPLDYLPNGMPLEHLLDLLDYGKVILDSQLKIQDIDDKGKNCLDISELERVTGNSIIQYISFSEDQKNYLLSKKWENRFFRLKSISHANLVFHKQSDEILLFVEPNHHCIQKNSDLYPFNQEFLEILPGPAWVIDQEINLIQLNTKAKELTKSVVGVRPQVGNLLDWGQKPAFYERFHRKLELLKSGNETQIDWRFFENDRIQFYQLQVKQHAQSGCFLVQGVDLTNYHMRLSYLQKENKSLRELVMKPSHLLRSPLSSMLGLLDLIDEGKLDAENKKYFTYLKPLAQELDDEIRSNAKSAAQFD